ncbi:MAG: hypothetical protein OH324_00320, partial [Candidatus Parvarchaeota archaeon]|nr:hypothetical protein [Candidatus Rehaiarchaeum fermentans]
MKKIFIILQIVFDLFVVGSSYYLCFYVGRHFGFDYTVRNLESLVIFTPYILIFSLILFLIYKVYDIEIFDLFEAFLNITLSTFLILIFGFALSFFVRAFALPRTVLIFSFPVQLVLILLIHFVFKKTYSKLIKIDEALFIASKGSTHNLDLLKGFFHVKNLRMISEGDFNLDNFQSQDIVSYNLIVVDNSIVADTKAKIIGFFASKNKKVLLIPSLYAIVINRAEFRHVNDLPLFEITPIEFDTLQLIVKRIIDLAISIVAL